jgi:hypothetical protein
MSFSSVLRPWTGICLLQGHRTTLDADTLKDDCEPFLCNVSEPLRLATLRASTARYKDAFTRSDRRLYTET